MHQRTVLVTGAAGGIGWAISERLAQDGFRVFAADLSAENSEHAAKFLGSNHRGLALDVTDEESVEAAFEEAEKEAPLFGVVAAAGLLILDENGQRRPLVEIGLEEWARTNAVNSTGTFLVTREFLRRRSKLRLDGASLITFASVAAQLGGYRSSSAYIASKGAVLGLTKAAAREAAPLGVRVNAIAPGLIDTPMLRLSLDRSDDVTAQQTIPLGRIGTPEDVAGAASFLLGRDAAYLTGAVIDVNGGYRMQ